MKKPTYLKFLQDVWNPHPSRSWLFLAAKGDRWRDAPIKNDQSRDAATKAFFAKYPATEFDLYFCPNPFSANRRKGDCALRTPYAWCDIDGADPDTFEPPPGILWETSPGRFQGLWHFTRALPSKRAAEISRYLTYTFDGDRNGWTPTKVLRIPGTYNHKRDGDPPQVKLHRFDLPLVNPRHLLGKAQKIRVRRIDDGLSDFNLYRNPKALLRRHMSAIDHRKARDLLRHDRVRVPDRSRQVFIMIKAMFDAHLPVDDIACLIWHSPYFREKHGMDVNMLEREIQNILSKLEMIK